MKRGGEFETNKTKRKEDNILKNTDEQYGNPNLAGDEIEREKSRSIKTKGTTTKKPENDDKKKNDQKRGKKGKPNSAIINITDLGKGLMTG